jgi:polysaccharide biosynthesis transport protein
VELFNDSRSRTQSLYGRNFLPESFDGHEVVMARPVLTSLPEENLGYGQLFAVLLRRRYWFLATFLGAVGVALFMSLYTKPTYRSSMQLLVDQNYRGKPVQSTTNPQFADSDVQADYATQLTLMNSSILIQRIVNRLRPTYPNLSIESVKKSLSVSQVTGKTAEKKVDTKIFEAAYEDLDPVKSQKVLQAVREVYQEYNREQQKLRLVKGLAFINDQVPQIQNQLTQAELALENFRKNQNFLNPELQSKALVESLENISRERRTNLIQVQDFRTQYEALGKKLALSPQAISLATRLSQSSRYQNLLNEIQKTELALLQERLRFTDQALSVKDLLKKLTEQKSQLLIEMQRISPDGAVTTSSSDSSAAMKAAQLGSIELNLASQFVDAQINLSVALARSESLVRIEKQYQQEMQRFPALLSEYNRLQPAVQLSKETLQQLLKARQDLGLEIARGGFDWQIVEDPKLGEKTGPDLKQNLLLGSVVGLFLGGITAFLRDAMDNSIQSLDELKRQTNLPLLGSVPEMLPQSKNQWGLVLPFRQLSPANNSTLQVINWLPFRESIDQIYKNIQLIEFSASLRSIMVTSILPGEGKSTLAIGLAISAARLHKRVLLIDADLRQPNLHKQLNLFNEEGLSTLLSRGSSLSAEKVIHYLSLNGSLSVLTAGPVPRDPARLLSSQQMAELMLEFEANYDLVLIDAPPILGTVDTAILSSCCSGAVLVERIGQANRKDLIQAAAVLNRLNIVGLIPNGVSHSTKRYTSDRKRNSS